MRMILLYVAMVIVHSIINIGIIVHSFITLQEILYLEKCYVTGIISIGVPLSSFNDMPHHPSD